MPDDAWEGRDLLAWSLAAGGWGRRDGHQAIEIATAACEMTDYKEASPLDTLAAAYAEIGDFKSAVKWSEKALAMVESDPVRTERYKRHLKSFRDGKPWREE